MCLILSTDLVNMYAKNGAITMARNVFDEMPKRNIATKNAMICRLVAHGYAEGALELFREMEKEEFTPNVVTFIMVLLACCHASLVEVGLYVFNSMKREYGIEPKIEHYGCMVDMLGQSGRLVEAEELINGWKTNVVEAGEGAFWVAAVVRGLGESGQFRGGCVGVLGWGKNGWRCDQIFSLLGCVGVPLTHKLLFSFKNPSMIFSLPTLLFGKRSLLPPLTA
ncbi:hypothetical protein Scep_030196 [Stephania cephalantha]|uniref:Pentatricopeptide repeat-containing protein n=1 Tax=Stephania cephalantha TaxID=152367 RepID=A0AAP0DZ33_9MAGN